MRLAHLADTHLGFSAYRRLSDEGVNIREQDVYDAFGRCIDHIIKMRPDVVVHAGDLFDGVRPNNRAISVALSQIRRLSEEQIPLILIAGNHETPRLRETGSIFRIFDHLAYVHAVYQGEYESFEIDGDMQESMMVHAVPHVSSQESFEKIISSISPSKKHRYNMFVCNGAVEGVEWYAAGSGSELVIPVDFLASRFDYVALGHYHKAMPVIAAGNAWYCGSLERMSFGEVEENKGVVEVEFRQDGVLPRFVDLPTRPMIDIGPIKARTLSVEEVMKEVFKQLKKINPAEKIVRIRLEGLSSDVYRGLDFKEIRRRCRDAVHCEIRTEVLRSETSPAVEVVRLESLSKEFSRFVSSEKIQQKKQLQELGLEYIGRVTEEGDS